MSSEGITLAQFIQAKGPLPSKQAARLACQLVRVLEAESSGAPGGRAPVLHAGRIRLGEGGKISVLGADAGAAAPVRNFPAHASPEEVTGTGADFRSSLYSLGCTLFQLVTGALPFGGTSPEETLRRQVDEAPPDPAEFALGVDPRFAAAIQALLAKDPAQRPANADAFIGLLTGAAAPRPAAAAAPPSPARSAAAVSPTRATSGAPAGRAPAGRTSAARGGPGRGAAASSRPAAPAARTGGPGRGGAGSRRHGGAAEAPGAARGAQGGSLRRGAGVRRRARGAAPADPFAEESFDGFDEAALAARPARSWIVTIGGVVVGLVLALLTFVLARGGSADSEGAEREMLERVAKEKLDGIKSVWSGRLQKERQEVETFLASQRQLATSPDDLRVAQARVEDALNTRLFNKPSAPQLATLAGELREAVESASLASGEDGGGSQSWDGWVAKYQSAFDQSKWSAAMQIMLDAEQVEALKSSHQEEIDQLFFRAEERMKEAWSADQRALDGFLRDGSIDKALAKVEEVKAYGDSLILRELKAYSDLIIAHSLSRREGGDDELEVAGDDDDDLGALGDDDDDLGDDDDGFDLDDLEKELGDDDDDDLGGGDDLDDL